MTRLSKTSITEYASYQSRNRIFRCRFHRCEFSFKFSTARFAIQDTLISNQARIMCAKSFFLIPWLNEPSYIDEETFIQRRRKDLIRRFRDFPTFRHTRRENTLSFRFLIRATLAFQHVYTFMKLDFFFVLNTVTNLHMYIVEV